MPNDTKRQMSPGEIFSQIDYHNRQLLNLRRAFAEGKAKTHYDACQLQHHRLSLEALRQQLPKPSLASERPAGFLKPVPAYIPKPELKDVADGE